MKKLATLLTLMAGVGFAFGQANVIHQSGLVSFQNTESGKSGVTGHLITNFNAAAGTRTPLIGTQYMAELYYLDTTTSSMIALPSTISPFKASTTSAPGTWNGPNPNQALPAGVGGVDYFDDGTGETGDFYPVTLAVRIWDSTTGATWENASVRTATANFIYTQHFSVPTAPTDTQMLTQGQGTITTNVPEPSAIALSILGVAGLLLIRRRK